MAITNLGKVSVTPKGEYDPLITYERLDVISHNGSSYIAKQASTGVTPIEGEFYALIAEKGDGGSFVKKAYKTYAAMDADKVNIPANSSVDVTNDPDESKNGAYIYDGSAFTRSQYDSKVVTDKIIADTAIAVQDAINNTAIEGSILADTFVVVDGSLSQRTVNKGLESIADLSTINNPKDGLRVYVKSYHAGLNKGGGYFTYDSSKVDKYDGGWFFNGWVRDNVTERSVIDYGAIGNWNRTTKQGANDTEVFQRVLDTLEFAGTLRHAGLRKIIVPAGHYMIDSITIRPEHRWGVHIEGFSGVSTLYFNKAIEEEAAIINETESVSFSNLNLEGNLEGERIPRDRESYGFLGRRPIDNAQLDIDVTFNNCNLYGWNTFARIEGRGFTMNGGGIGASGTLLEIHARDVVLIPSPE